MNLWFSSHFLVVGLFLSSSALTPEECQPLIMPLADPSLMYNRTNFIMGYTDNDVYNAILKVTESSWVKITPSPHGPKEVVMDQENKINGSCFASTTHVSIDGNSGTTSIGNISSVFHLLPSCEGCLVFSINSTGRDLNKFLDLMKFNAIAEEKFSARAIYLMARESTVKDSDLEHFKQQASCLGFSKEPDFHYDPKNEFCAEGEGIKMNFT